MLAAKLKVVIALLYEPFANMALLILHDAAIVHFVILFLNLKVHLLDVLRLESFGRLLCPYPIEIIF